MKEKVFPLTAKALTKMGLYLNLPFSLSTSAVLVFPSRIATSSAVKPRHINFYNTHVHN